MEYDLSRYANRAGARLFAQVRAATEREPLNPTAIMFSTVLHHLKQHGLKADFPDDEQNSLMVNGSLAQVLMGLSSLGWTHGPEEEVVGGLYCAGAAVTVEAMKPLRVMQTSVSKVIIWQAQDPSTIPPEKVTNETDESPQPQGESQETARETE